MGSIKTKKVVGKPPSKEPPEEGSSFRGVAIAWLGNIYGVDPDGVNSLERLLQLVADGVIQPTDGCTCTADGDICEACDDNLTIMIVRM